jgi:hypothetical protein
MSPHTPLSTSKRRHEHPKSGDIGKSALTAAAAPKIFEQKRERERKRQKEFNHSEELYGIRALPPPSSHGRQPSHLVGCNATPDNNDPNTGSGFVDKKSRRKASAFWSVEPPER